MQSLVDSLDKQLLLQVEGWIEGAEEASGSVDVEVWKKNEEDGAPSFLTPSYSFTVPENSLTGTSVGSVKAVGP